MKVRLGYACISETLGDVIPSKTITYEQFRKLGHVRGMEKIKSIINENLDNLMIILKYNVANNIHFYRISSHMIPLFTHPDIDIDIKSFSPKLREIGNYIKEYNLRVDLHPDQYCVLNSTKKEVIENSIGILYSFLVLYQGFDLDGQLILHIGSSEVGKTRSKGRFMNNFELLLDQIQDKIVLENNDKFNVTDTVDLCEKLNVPMVLDYRQHLCNYNKHKIEDFLGRILKTWQYRDIPPKIQFSSPKSKQEKAIQSDYIQVNHFIDFIERLKEFKTDVDIMIEAKKTDEALFRLVRELKLKTNYQFLDDTTFITN